MLGNIRPQTSQFAEPLCTDPCIKSGIGVRELIATSKKKKKKNKVLTGNEWSNILPRILASNEKATTQKEVRSAVSFQNGYLSHKDSAQWW